MEEERMIGFFIMLGTMAATALVLAILAVHSRRQERRERDARRS